MGKGNHVLDVKTINRRLDGEVKNEHEMEYCSILTVDEEKQIAEHVKNKNRAIQGIGHVELTKLIIHMLKVRKFGLQKLHGHKFHITQEVGHCDALLIFYTAVTPVGQYSFPKIKNVCIR